LRRIRTFAQTKSHLFYIIGNNEVIGFEDLGKGKTFKPALNGLVLLIKGNYSNWKLPLVYYFTHNTCKAIELQNIIEEYIQKLKTINLSVKVVVNDMGSSNICVSNNLNVTPERPFFYYRWEQVVYMFDAPHLLKATSNMLMKHIFCFDGKSTSCCWNFVQPLLEHPLCRRGGDVQKQKSTLKRQIDTRLETRLNYRLYTNPYLYFKLFNKLLVLPNTTINFGPSTQREHAPMLLISTTKINLPSNP
jgi:hypothetical protein